MEMELNNEKIENWILNNPKWQKQLTMIEKMRDKHIIYPEQKAILEAFKDLTFQAVKVVVIGQDPYHSPNMANGLAFGIKPNAKIPPSLKNIAKELKNDLNEQLSDFSLKSWKMQGVLLINTILSVEQGKPLSHKNQGWEQLVLNVLKKVESTNHKVIYLALGTNAYKISKMICEDDQRIVATSHPSPLGAYRGFINSKIFSKINQQLKNNGDEIIRWGKEVKND